MKTLNLGRWPHQLEPGYDKLRHAAEVAHRLSYKAARLTLPSGVVILILAHSAEREADTEHFFLAPGLPERPELFGLHPVDTLCP